MGQIQQKNQCHLCIIIYAYVINLLLTSNHAQSVLLPPSLVATQQYHPSSDRWTLWTAKLLILVGLSLSALDKKLWLYDFTAVCGKIPLRLFQSYCNVPKLKAKQFIVKVWFGRTVIFLGDMIISGIGTEITRLIYMLLASVCIYVLCM